jgi:hypothetical protein
MASGLPTSGSYLASQFESTIRSQPRGCNPELYWRGSQTVEGTLLMRVFGSALI